MIRPGILNEEYLIVFDVYTYLLKGKTDVVAPISAPILQIVPMPVQDIESTPGP